MLQKLEGVHVGFLRQVEGKKAQKMPVNNWRKEGAERVIQGTGKKPLQEYIERTQATVADWVALRPIFEVLKKCPGTRSG